MAPTIPLLDKLIVLKPNAGLHGFIRQDSRELNESLEDQVYTRRYAHFHL